MKTWQQLLRRVSSVKNEKYGPHTKEITSALMALQDADWYANVGQPSPMDDKVMRVGSWDDAWTILDDTDERYVPRGMLKGPTLLVMHARETDPIIDARWRDARKLLLDLEYDDPPVGESWPFERQAMTSDHLFNYFERLLEEILLSDSTPCTYFREQLPWFAAGYFPCGWEGDWPVGKMRVY